MPIEARIYTLAASGCETRARPIVRSRRPLDQTLREQQSVEHVAGRRLGLRRREGVTLANRYDFDAQAFTR